MTSIDSGLFTLEWAESISRRRHLHSTAAIILRRRLLVELTSGRLMAFPADLPAPVVRQGLCLRNPYDYVNRLALESLGITVATADVFQRPHFKPTMDTMAAHVTDAIGHGQVFSTHAFHAQATGSYEQAETASGGVILSQGPSPTTSIAAGVTEVTGPTGTVSNAHGFPSHSLGQVTTATWLSVEVDPSVELSSFVTNSRFTQQSSGSTCATLHEPHEHQHGVPLVRENSRMIASMLYGTPGKEKRSAGSAAALTRSTEALPSVDLSGLRMPEYSMDDYGNDSVSDDYDTGTGDLEDRPHTAIGEEGTAGLRSPAHVLLNRQEAPLDANALSPADHGALRQSSGSELVEAVVPNHADMTDGGVEGNQGVFGRLSTPSSDVCNSDTGRNTADDVQADSTSGSDASATSEAVADDTEEGQLQAQMLCWLEDNFYRLAMEHCEVYDMVLLEAGKHVLETSLREEMRLRSPRLADSDVLLEAEWRDVIDTFVSDKFKLRSNVRPCPNKTLSHDPAKFVASHTNVESLSEEYHNEMGNVATGSGTTAADRFLELAGDPHQDVTEDCDLDFLSFVADLRLLMTCGLVTPNKGFTPDRKNRPPPKLTANNYENSSVLPNDFYLGAIANVEDMELHIFFDASNVGEGQLINWLRSIDYEGDEVAAARDAIAEFKMDPLAYLFECITRRQLYKVPGIDKVPVLNKKGELNLKRQAQWHTYATSIVLGEPAEGEPRRNKGTGRCTIVLSDLARLLQLFCITPTVKLFMYGMKAAFPQCEERLFKFEKARAANTEAFAGIGNRSVRSTRTVGDSDSYLKDILAVRAVRLLEAAGPPWEVSQFNAFLPHTMEKSTVPGCVAAVAYGNSKITLPRSRNHIGERNWMHLLEAAAHAVLGEASTVPTEQPDLLMYDVTWYSEFDHVFRVLQSNNKFFEQSKKLEQDKATAADARRYMAQAKALVENLRAAIAANICGFALRMEVKFKIAANVPFTPQLLKSCLKAARLHNVLRASGMRLEVREIFATDLGKDMLLILNAYEAARLKDFTGDLSKTMGLEMRQLLHSVLNCFGKSGRYQYKTALAHPGLQLARWIWFEKHHRYIFKELVAAHDEGERSLMLLLHKLAKLAPKMYELLQLAHAAPTWSIPTSMLTGRYGSIEEFWDFGVMSTIEDMIHKMHVRKLPSSEGYRATRGEGLSSGNGNQAGQGHHSGHGGMAGKGQILCMGALLTSVLSLHFGGGEFTTDEEAAALVVNLFGGPDLWHEGPTNIKTERSVLNGPARNNVKYSVAERERVTRTEEVINALRVQAVEALEYASIDYASVESMDESTTLQVWITDTALGNTPDDFVACAGLEIRQKLRQMPVELRRTTRTSRAHRNEGGHGVLADVRSASSSPVASDQGGDVESSKVPSATAAGVRVVQFLASLDYNGLNGNILPEPTVQCEQLSAAIRALPEDNEVVVAAAEVCNVLLRAKRRDRHTTQTHSGFLSRKMNDSWRRADFVGEASFGVVRAALDALCDATVRYPGHGVVLHVSPQPTTRGVQQGDMPDSDQMSFAPCLPRSYRCKHGSCQDVISLWHVDDATQASSWAVALIQFSGGCVSRVLLSLYGRKADAGTAVLTVARQFGQHTGKPSHGLIDGLRDGWPIFVTARDNGDPNSAVLDAFGLVAVLLGNQGSLSQMTHVNFRRLAHQVTSERNVREIEQLLTAVRRRQEKIFRDLQAYFVTNARQTVALGISDACFSIPRGAFKLPILIDRLSRWYGNKQFPECQILNERRESLIRVLACNIHSNSTLLPFAEFPPHEDRIDTPLSTRLSRVQTERGTTPTGAAALRILPPRAARAQLGDVPNGVQGAYRSHVVTSLQCLSALMRDTVFCAVQLLLVQDDVVETTGGNALTMMVLKLVAGLSQRGQHPVNIAELCTALLEANHNAAAMMIPRDPQRQIYVDMMVRVG